MTLVIVLLVLYTSKRCNAHSQNTNSPTVVVVDKTHVPNENTNTNRNAHIDESQIKEMNNEKENELINPVKKGANADMKRPSFQQKHFD
jgi:hypothetical protein